MARHERLTVNKLYVNDIVNQVQGGNIEFGVNDTGVDVKLYGATSGSFALWDESLDKMVFDAADLQLGDSDELRFGDLAAGDWVFKFDGADFTVLPASTVEALNIGNTTYHANVTIGGALAVGATAAGHGEDTTLHASGSAAYVMLDASANKMIFEGVNLQLNDSEELRLGSLTAGDWVAKFDGADLSILPASATEALNIGGGSNLANITLRGALTVGVNDTGHDVSLFGASSGAKFLWDESEDAVILTLAEIEFDSYKSDGAFDFANDANGWQMGSVAAATTPIGAVKIKVGGTTGYIAVHSSFTAA